MDRNVVGWFEIPAFDLDRAQKFYEEVLGLELERQVLGPLEMAWFPWLEDAVGSPGSVGHRVAAQRERGRTPVRCLPQWQP